MAVIVLIIASVLIIDVVSMNKSDTLFSRYFVVIVSLSTTSYPLLKSVTKKKDNRVVPYTLYKQLFKF